MELEIKSAEIETRSIVRARDQRKFAFREQAGFVKLNDEVRKITVSLAEDQAPYPVGKYLVLLEGSAYVDRNGRLALGRLALKPLSAGMAAQR